MLDLLLLSTARANAAVGQLKTGMTPLHLAVMQNDLERATTILSNVPHDKKADLLAVQDR